MAVEAVVGLSKFLLLDYVSLAASARLIKCSKALRIGLSHITTG
jgi:hypothetical protein